MNVEPRRSCESHLTRRKRRSVTVLFGLLSAIVVVFCSTLALSQQWTEFTGNTPAKASQVNANFDIVAPPGVIMAYVGDEAPAGWLLCNGQTISSDNYPALAATMGQSGSFSVPDLSSRFPLGKGPSTNIHDTGGTASVNVVVAHSHPVAASGEHRHRMRAGQGASVNDAGDGFARSTYQNDDVSFFAPHSYIAGSDGGHTHTTNTTGDAAVTNMPPYVVLNYIIKI